MKFLVIGDLHGQEPKIKYDNFDAIIAPGDFCSDAARTYMFQALKERLANPESELQWYDIVGREKAKEMIETSIKDGRRILENLNDIGVPVYIVPGNWDWAQDSDSDWDYLQEDHFTRLIDGLENIVSVYHGIVDVGDYQIIGHGVSSGPEYPQYKEDLERIKPDKLQDIKDKYETETEIVGSLFREATKPVIFISHNVPFDTPIDEITDPKSPRNGYHYGSLIAREAIDKYQPLVCIGGHMHEHFTSCRIGKTVAINAGFGGEVNVFLELTHDKISTLEFHDK